MEDLLLLEYYCALSTIYKFYCINSVEARLRARVDVFFFSSTPVSSWTRDLLRKDRFERENTQRVKRHKCEEGWREGGQGGRKVRNHSLGNTPPSAGDSTM